MRLTNLHFNGFDWDEGNTSKIKNRISIGIVETFFRQRLLITEDTRHSIGEERYLAIGYTSEGRCCLVAYTVRVKDGQKLIRPISARYTHKKEERAYEEQIKKFKEKEG